MNLACTQEHLKIRHYTQTLLVNGVDLNVTFYTTAIVSLRTTVLMQLYASPHSPKHINNNV